MPWGWLSSARPCHKAANGDNRGTMGSLWQPHCLPTALGARPGSGAVFGSRVLWGYILHPGCFLSQRCPCGVFSFPRGVLVGFGAGIQPRAPIQAPARAWERGYSGKKPPGRVRFGAWWGAHRSGAGPSGSQVVPQCPRDKQGPCEVWGQPPAWVFTHQTRVSSGITWCHGSVASTERPQNLALHVPKGATWPRDPPRAGEAPPEGSAAGHEARTSDEGSLPSAQRGQGGPRSCGGNAGGWRRAGSGIWGRATRLEDTKNSLCSSSPTTSSKGEEKPRHRELLRGSPTPQSQAGHTASPSRHRGDNR